MNERRETSEKTEYRQGMEGAAYEWNEHRDPDRDADAPHIREPLKGTQEPDPFDDAEDNQDEPYCHRCDNSGWILVCIDDLCHNSGEEPGERRIHGDGDILCPACKGRNVF